jgi:hypothetical protein
VGRAYASLFFGVRQEVVCGMAWWLALNEVAYMASMAEELVSLLGRREKDSETVKAISQYSLIDLGSIEHGSQYVGSYAQGVVLRFEFGRLMEVQIHVEPKIYEFESPPTSVAAYTGLLPFALRRGMSKGKVREVLSAQAQGREKNPDLGGHFLLCEGRVRVLLRFGKGVMRYLSVSLSEGRGSFGDA